MAKISLSSLLLSLVILIGISASVNAEDPEPIQSATDTQREWEPIDGPPSCQPCHAVNRAN